MNHEGRLRAIRDVIQRDVGNRGLARDPAVNLFTAFADDFAAACRSLVEHPDPVLDVVTGFWIPRAQCGETDGPLGAVYLARTLPLVGVRVVLVSDPFCLAALEAGLNTCGQSWATPVLYVPEGGAWRDRVMAATHRLALERVGPSHTPASVRAQFAPLGRGEGRETQSRPSPPTPLPHGRGEDEATVRQFLAEVPVEHHDRCHTMRGIDITPHMRDASPLFAPGGPVTIGVGDGGNEIGMGKFPWTVIRDNIPNGAVVACRVAVDHLIVAGVSNWGAYALASGVAVLRGFRPPAEWYDPILEHDLLARMVEQGGLVDGVTGQRAATVDGLTFEDYIEPLRRLGEIVRG